MSRWILTLSSLVVLPAIFGCGGSSDAPDTIGVGGTVTLDDQPLPDAVVTFAPVDPTQGLRMVSGKTDSSGYYELDYSSTTSGTMPGKYKVTITTADEDMDGNILPEKVPDAYNTQSDLTANVTPDKTEFNFDLDSSKGEVIQKANIDIVE